MSGGENFVVRNLEWKSLDGALRVHLLPESLEQLGLTTGDVCGISVENDSGESLVRVFGLAWRALDRMGNTPKVKPVKLSYYLKDILDVKDGSRITVTKADRQIVPAKKIVLLDVTPAEQRTVEHDTKWRMRAMSVIGFCEAITKGVTFEIVAKKSLKRRFRVEQIASDAPEAVENGLYTCEDFTEVIITDQNSTENCSMPLVEVEFNLKTDRIGGLDKQVEILYDQIRCVLDQTQYETPKSVGLPINEGILIQGYEGTGKSLILDCLENAGFRKVSRLQKSTFPGNSISHNQAFISATFHEARKNQPSLILLDDLKELVPRGDITYAKTITSELNSLGDTRVVVVATCRSLNEIDSSVLKPGLFSFLIELPIPDFDARKDILETLLCRQKKAKSNLPEMLALRTHGFTGQDIMGLLRCAQATAMHRSVRRHQAGNLTFQAEKITDQGVLRGAINNTDIGYPGIECPNGLQEDYGTDVTLEDWSSALARLRPTALREIFFERPNVRWSDIGGSQVVKARFDQILGWPIHHADLIKSHNMKPEKGVLLYGPPGCSKTMTAQAVAATYELNFIAIKGAELISKYVGDSEHAVREIFRKARAAAPCVIFFDEIDAIASTRDASGTSGLNVLTTLLNEMDGFDVLNNVLVLAATNKPEILDPAIMRPGRFGSHVYLGPPGEQARREILSISMRDVPVQEDVRFDLLASQTDGYSGAEIIQICEQAKVHNIRYCIAEGVDIGLRTIDFDAAIKETKRGITDAMIASYMAFDGRLTPAKFS